MLNKISTKPIVLELTKLANQSITDAERELIQNIIELLFMYLDKGNSCLALNQINILAKRYAMNIPENMSVKLIVDLLQHSNLVGNYEFGNIYQEIKPLMLVTNPEDQSDVLLYITRYLHYELEVAKLVNQINQASNLGYNTITKVLQPILLSTTSGFPNQEQIMAIKASALNKLSIITGGPGTGKTTTVVLLLWVLKQCYSSNLKINICAPTGKAASRIKESIVSGITNLSKWLNLDSSSNWSSIECTTIHKLLGYQRESIYFKFNEANKLHTEILIIDESSMVSLPLFYKLLVALDLDQLKHLILLGDKNQLSSVEEGYVFASIIDYYSSCKLDLFSNSLVVNQLVTSNRNSPAIKELALNILNSDLRQILANFKKYAKLELHLPGYKQVLNKILNSESEILRYFEGAKQFDLVTSNPKYIFDLFRRFSILCVTNEGIFGVNNINQQIDNFIRDSLNTDDTWYNGRPVIILENDYILNLNNGDIGICWCDEDGYIILFEDGRKFLPEVLPQNSLAYAITIHKSQGSEFDNVMIIIPEENDLKSSCNEVLSSELLYTAVTRAKSNLYLFVTDKTLNTIINKKAFRSSGLKYLLANV